MGEENELDNFTASWRGWLVGLALLSGVGNGVVGVTQDTSSRYRAEDAGRDFALRDERMQAQRSYFMDRLNRRRDNDKETTARLHELENAFREHLRRSDAYANKLDKRDN